jgi:hypothetical protein
MTDAVPLDYDVAVLRVVPLVHLGSFVNVGVVVHARAAEFIALRVMTDPAALRTRLPGMDTELLARYLRASEAICAGDAAAGPVALAPPSERFHWLTAPRSDVLQCSPVHEGMTSDLRREVERLYQLYVEQA